jgi:transcriptional regulator with XRE-family HTH domain
VVAHGYIFSGERLKEVRKMRRISLGSLAAHLFRYERLKISDEALRRYELGKRSPSFNLVVSLAAALHCDVTKLCGPKRTRGVTIERLGRQVR